MAALVKGLKSLWQHATGQKPEQPKYVLVIDDDIDAVITVSHVLREAGYTLAMASDMDKALRLLHRLPIGLVITDLWMPGRTGLDVLKKAREIRPDTQVVIMTARGDWDTYLEANDNQALEYLQKPVRKQELLDLARRAFEPVEAPATH